MVQALRAGRKAKRVKFSNAISLNMEDDNFLPHLMFSDEATSHISGEVNLYNIRIWKVENPQEILKRPRDFPEANVTCFCTVSFRTIYGSYFFEKNTISRQTDFKLLQQ